MPVYNQFGRPQYSLENADGKQGRQQKNEETYHEARPTRQAQCDAQQNRKCKANPKAHLNPKPRNHQLSLAGGTSERLTVPDYGRPIQDFSTIRAK